MTTRNFQFFARRLELIEMLGDIATSKGLWLVIPASGGHRVLEADDIDASGLKGVDTVFIASARPSAEDLSSMDVIPAKLGWLHLDLPIEDGDNLFLADFAMKSDWYDRQNDKRTVNNTLGSFYKKLRSDIRRRLENPVWAKNIVTGGVAKYADMGFSAGAKEWEHRGGELRQVGVKNVRFSTANFGS